MAAEELIGIKLNLEGYEGVMKDLRTLDSYVKAHKRDELELNLDNARREVMAYRGEIQKLTKDQKELGRAAAEAYPKYVEAINQYNKAVQNFGKAYEKSAASSFVRKKMEEGTKAYTEISKKIRDNNKALEENKNSLKHAQMAVSEYSYALGQLKKQLTFGQVFNKISSSIAHIGSAMQSAGNALTRLTSPLRRITTGLLMGVGYKALNMFTEGFGNAFERYDIMQNYARTLSAFGFSAEDAAKQVDKLNESVIGLPTGLDEIVAMQKVYVGATNDLAKATDIAIAANNTFLASGMGSREQRFMQKYLVALGSGAELAATQWDSMFRIAPLAMRSISEELGYASDEYDDFRKSVKNGDIATRDFLNAFIKVGTSGKISDAANVMKMTWSGLTANISNATKRMGEGIIKSLDSVFKAYNGRTLLQTLLGVDAEGKSMGDGIKDWINDISASVQEWIKANPDKIIEFFEKLRSIDWKGLLEGFVEGMSEVGKAISWFLDAVGGKDLNSFGKWAMRLHFLGGALTIIGGIFKGIRHPVGIIGAGIWKIANKFKGSGGLLGKIKELFGGKNADKTIAEAPKAMTTLRNVVKSLEGTLTIAGQIAIPALTGLVVTKSFKEILKDLRSIGWLVQDVDWKSATKAMVAFGGFITAFAGAGMLASRDLPAAVDVLKGTAVAGAISWLASFAASETMRQVKSGVGFFKEMTESFGEISTNLKDLDTSSMGSSAKKVGEMLSYLNSLTDTLAGTMVNGEQQGGMKLVPESVKLSVQNLSAIITALGDISEKFKGYKDSFVDNETISKIGDSLGLLMEQLTNAFSNYTYGFDETNTAEVKAAIENISGMLNAVIGENGLLALARQFIFETADIPGVTNPIEGSKAPLQRMFDSLAEIYRGYQEAFYDIGDTSTIVTKMSNLAEAIESIRLIFKKMRKIQGYDMERVGGMGQYKAIQMIQNLIGQLKVTFGGQEITSLKSNIQGFVDSVNSLMDSIDSLTGEHEIEASVKLKSNEVIGADKVVKTIEDAVTAIQNAWKKMPYSLSRTININVGGRLNASGFNSALERGRRYTGVQPYTGGYASRKGLLYRSNGGSIFKPRGTDVIPAMLSEGEYVQRKKAVDTFGIDFMRKVNNLDVRGAVQALLARGGNVTSTLNRQSVVNNTVNDNRRVTQNINTNNPSMARMSLGRFAGAL